jgi:hypothetical protein
MTEHSSRDTQLIELPRGWYRMTLAALASFAVGCMLVACSLVAWWLMLLPTGEAFRGIVRLFYDRWSLAFGLFALAVGVACWTRAWIRLPRILPPLALLLGVVLITVTGYREVHAPARSAPQVTHALIGLGAIVLTLLGLVAAPRAFGPLAALVALGRPAHRLATAMRIVAYLGLALGTLVPFAPRLFGDATPAAWALRIAAAGALVFALPLFATAGGSLAFLIMIRRARAAAPACHACGYPRPPRTRCPECGRDA